MAVQNRKTEQQRRSRVRAQREVDRFIAYLQGLDAIDRIASEGRSLMGMWADFKGKAPAGSGFSGFCVLADKLDRIRRSSAPDEFVRAFDRLMALYRRAPKCVMALCVDRFYRGRTKVATDPFTEARYEIRWTDEACGRLLGCRAKVFQRRVSKGYAALESMLFEVGEIAA